MKSNKLLIAGLVLALIVGISEARWGRKSSSSRSRGGSFGSIFKKVFSKAKIPKVHKFGDTLASVAQRSETARQPALPTRESSQAQQEPISVLPISGSERPETAPTDSRTVRPRKEIPYITIFELHENTKPLKLEDRMKYEIDQDPLLEDYPSNSDLIL